MNDKKNFASLINISKNFGKVKALNSVSIDISKNKITSIVGDNGSGKSTLIKILSGTLKPDSGYLFINDTKYSNLTPKIANNLGISTVYQDLSLDNFKDIPSNIFLGTELTKFGIVLNHKKMLEETAKLLYKLDINIQYLKTPVGYLSGGQRQSVAIARAIYQGENLIIFDEPTAAMGVRESNAINKLIKSLPEKGFTVVVISHDINQVFEVSDFIYILRHGEIIDFVEKHETSTLDLIEKISQN